MNIEEIDNEIHRLEQIINDKMDKYDTYLEFEANIKEEREKIDNLSIKKRMMITGDNIKYSEIPDYGDVFSIKDFIINVKLGGIIDDDGYGRYIKDNKMTNIEIYPSDVKKNLIRKEFDIIIWFNR